MQEELRRLVTRLELQPHPEGGYFRETYRSPELLTALPERFEGPRSSPRPFCFCSPMDTRLPCIGSKAMRSGTFIWVRLYASFRLIPTGVEKITALGRHWTRVKHSKR